MSNSPLEVEVRALRMRQLVQGLVLEKPMRLIPPPNIARSLGRLLQHLDEEMTRQAKSLDTHEDEAMTIELVCLLVVTVVMPHAED